ncbi:hypothetical protein MKX01_005606 [Papaver californicum]|nr:hypothetical protein MKX01_005606 [Papaver californicum]
MASIFSSLCFQSLGRRISPCNSIPNNNTKGIRNWRNQSIVQCNQRTTHLDNGSSNCIEEEEQSKKTKRREALIQLAEKL